MSGLMIEKGILIDDKEAVKEGIEQISGKCLSDMGTVKRFITNEKATKFYLDSKGLCKMQPDRNTVYLWLDSGYTDDRGNPVMISLLKDGDGYAGHYSGTMQMLARSIREYYPCHKKDINRNIGSLRNKYNNKIESREHLHIDSEKNYLLQLCNGEKEPGIMKQLIQNLDFQDVEPVFEEVQPEEEKTEEIPYDTDFGGKEITVGLLLDTIDGMQAYIDELLGEIEKFNTVDRVRMQELEAKNEEYRKAIVRIRTYQESVDQNAAGREETGNGVHQLLNHKKILVLGATALDVHVMNGIAKLYGFHKDDFEYETDYEKIVNFAGRIHNGERYAAIIFGACPHKVSRMGDWSSVIEKFHQCEEAPVVIDARNHSGELKVTKGSFKMALLNVCEELKNRRV